MSKVFIDKTGDPMTDPELEKFITDLRKFCTEELDQHEHWRVPTPHGDVFISIERRTDYPDAFTEPMTPSEVGAAKTAALRKPHYPSPPAPGSILGNRDWEP